MHFRHWLLKFAVLSAVVAALGCSSDSGSPAPGSGTNNPNDPSGGSDADKPLPATADSGFRPAKDGFAFQNYAGMPGTGIFNAGDLRRMFGDKVCSTIANDVCTLKPQGQDWIDKINTSLEGGH